MGSKVKRRHRRVREQPKATPTGVKKPSRLQVLVGLLALSLLSGAAILRLNTNEVTTQIPPQELEMKKQMMEQFMQKQAGAQEGASEVAQETTLPAR